MIIYLIKETNTNRFLATEDYGWAKMNLACSLGNAIDKENRTKEKKEEYRKNADRKLFGGTVRAYKNENIVDGMLKELDMVGSPYVFKKIKVD